MPLLRLSLLTLALAAVLAPGLARADERDIRRADNGVSVEAGALNLDYVEHVGGVGLDSEKGWLPTVGIGLHFLSSRGATIPNLYARLEARGSFGSTLYSGALCDQFGTCRPYQSTTDDRIITGTAELVRAFALGPSLLLTPFGELGYRYWLRDLGGTGGYGEAYRNWEAMGGLLLQYSPAARWVLSLSGSGGTIFGASLQTFSETFQLGDKPIWRAEGKAGYRLSERVELTASAAYQSFGFRASPVDANGFFEPDSTTHETTLLLGLAYHFF